MKMVREHLYAIHVSWTGNVGTGTSSYAAYKRDHELLSLGKTPIAGSSDPAFRGDSSRYNPEELLVGALSACHMLWYLHLCADSGIVVTSYEDQATGKMRELDNRGGQFEEVVLNPKVVVKHGADLQFCKELHEKAHSLCFIASSVNFSVRCEPNTLVEDQ